MQIRFLARFSRDIDDIGDKATRKKLFILIEEFESAPSLAKIGNLKKLAGAKNAYRVRLGDYRVGFFYENGVVEFARILHRKEIYRAFP